MNTLKDIDVNKVVIVKRINGTGAIKRRIMDMGITNGTEIYVRKFAPLGDPMQINIRGYELTLRKADAEMILVDDFKVSKAC